MSEQTAVQNELSMAQTILALRNENAILKEQLSLVQQQYEWLKKQVFGRKSEQTCVIMEEGTQLALFPDEAAQDVPEPEEAISVPRYKRKKKRTHDDWMSSLPIEEKRYEEEHPVCEKCGAEMKEIGEEKAYDELIYTPAKFHVRRHIVKKYKCLTCGEKPENDVEHEDEIEHCHIRRAPYPKPMIPRSYCSPELLAHIIYEKYGKAVALHRQEKDFASKGIPLLKATMSHWVGVAAEQWCLPVVGKMRELLVAGEVVHGDETTIQVLHEEGRKPTTKSRMWVYCNGKMNSRSIIIFDYQPTRKGEHAARFLKKFSGYMICDGYDE